MSVTKIMILERGLKHLEEEKTAEEESIARLEGNKLQSVIIMRNKKRMYIAEIDQMIRNIKEQIKEQIKELQAKGA